MPKTTKNLSVNGLQANCTQGKTNLFDSTTLKYSLTKGLPAKLFDYPRTVTI